MHFELIVPAATKIAAAPVATPGAAGIVRLRDQRGSARLFDRGSAVSAR